jgi:dTMP kinase
VNTRGLLIVFEGVEGVGKTTQWKRLRDVFTQSGHSVVSLREPGGTPVGDAIRTIVLNSPIAVSDRAEALLFAASRAEIISEVIQPALQRGDIVLLDRFLLSTYAYQGAGRGIRMKDLQSINAFATRDVTPDLTMLLHMPVSSALHRANQRSAADRIEREDSAFHARVADAFMRATTAEWQDQHPECGPIELVDATGAADAVTQRCFATLARRWPEKFDTLQYHATLSIPVAMNAGLHVTSDAPADLASDASVNA